MLKEYKKINIVFEEGQFALIRSFFTRTGSPERNTLKKTDTLTIDQKVFDKLTNQECEELLVVGKVLLIEDSRRISRNRRIFASVFLLGMCVIPLLSMSVALGIVTLFMFSDFVFRPSYVCEEAFLKGLCKYAPHLAEKINTHLNAK